MAAHGARARAGAAQLPAKQKQIDDLLNVRDRVLVLRQPHRPADDCARRLNIDSRGLAHLLARHSALLDQLVPAHFNERAREISEAVRLLLDELAVEHFAGPPLFFLQHLFHDSFQERHVAVDPNLQEEVGELCPWAEEVERVLRVLEAVEAGFGQRVDVNDTAAALLCRL